MASITKMPFDTVIAPAKLKDYLWVWRGKDDKSKMTYTLFEQVALTRDISEKNLRKGDVATIVELHPMRQEEDGYSLELFNGIGETIVVITVPE
jgi:hypothetical protein